MDTPWDGTIKESKFLDEFKVMRAFTKMVTEVDGSTRDGSRRRMVLGTDMIRLEHVPIRLNHLTHPQTVVRTVNHV